MPGAIPALDGLRAIAVVLVLLRHAARPFWDEGGKALLPAGGWDLAIPMVNGWIGVDLFFVLSGFLIGRQLLGDRGGQGRPTRGYGRYLLKRALRILPAYYAVLAIAAFDLVPYFSVAPDHLGIRVAWHALMLQDYLPSNIVVVFWSLGVEEKFYLLAPGVVALVLMLPRGSAQYLALLALAGCGLLFRGLADQAHPEQIDYDTFFGAFRSPAHLCMEPLVLGLLAAFVHRDRAGRHLSAARFLFWAGAGGTIMLLTFEPMLDTIGAADRLWQPALIALAMACLVFGAASGGAPAGFAGASLTVTARLSYTLYLVHLLTIPGLMVLLDVGFGAQAWTPAQRFAIFLPLFLGLSYMLALGLHLTVERPFLRLKDRIA